MWRAGYRLLLWLAFPFVLARLWWRGRHEPGYRQNIAERFGFYPTRPARPVIWLHAVSVGETRAAVAPRHVSHPPIRRATRSPASRASWGRSRIARLCSACIPARAAHATTGARARRGKRAKEAIYSRPATSERPDGFKRLECLFRRGA